MSSKWYRRVWDALWKRERPAEPAVQPADDQEYEPPAGSEEMVIASRGDVFNLHLIPYFRWTSSDMPFEVLAQRSARYVEPARGRLLREVWRTVRRFGPNDVAAAEEAVNSLTELRRGWCYHDERGVVRCRPTVRVTLDPRLREHTLPLELERLRLDFAHQYAMADAEQIETRTERWLHAVKKLEQIPELGPVQRQFLAPFCALMADERFAVTMTAVADLRAERTDDLLTVLQQAGKDHEGVGLFEFANAYDKAVSAFAQQMGVDPYRWAHEGTNP
jgi:hypothetical protein